MSTVIRTAKSKYQVESVQVTDTGHAYIVVRTPSRRIRYLGVKDVGRPRFDAAVQHYFARRA